MNDARRSLPCTSPNHSSSIRASTSIALGDSQNTPSTRTLE